MKWFKFESCEFDDSDHQEMIERHGLKAFAIYIGIRCFIAGKMTPKSEPEIEILETTLCRKFRTKAATMRQVIDGYALLGRWMKTRNSGKYHIKMPNLLSALDEWSARSRATPEQLGKEERRGEENRGNHSAAVVTNSILPSNSRAPNPPPPPDLKQKEKEPKALLVAPLFSPLAEFQKDLITQTYPREFLADRLQTYIVSASARGIKTMRPQPILRMLAEDFEQFKKENNRKAREQTDRNKPAAPVECSPPPPEWNEVKKKIKRSAA